MKSHRTIFSAVSLLALASVARAETLSHNLDQDLAGTEMVTASRWVAASFGTDGVPHELTSITLPVNLTAGNKAGVALDLYTSVGPGLGQPGTLIATLTTPASLPEMSEAVTFTAGGLALAPSSTYWVVLRTKNTGTVITWTWTELVGGSGSGFQHTWGLSEDSGGTWATYDTQPMHMQVEADYDYPWTDLGFGLAGFTTPLLEGFGGLQPGSYGGLKLHPTLPSLPTVLFVSTSNAPTPFKGGLLVPVPVEIALPVFATYPYGYITGWGSWPPGLSGAILYFQCALQHPLAVKGVALSNALEAVVP